MRCKAILFSILFLFIITAIFAEEKPENNQNTQPTPPQDLEVFRTAFPHTSFTATYSEKLEDWLTLLRVGAYPRADSAPVQEGDPLQRGGGGGKLQGGAGSHTNSRDPLRGTIHAEGHHHRQQGCGHQEVGYRRPDVHRGFPAKARLPRPVRESPQRLAQQRAADEAFRLFVRRLVLRKTAERRKSAEIFPHVSDFPHYCSQ